ncbi:uncharacterized protein LOC127185863 isoform X2 [Acomys russatus]|uniref:uncharacterized protein LOC127185862 isoform X2 n=1 Tax=Acomys russatus TaxID=60746 RepID=UPI0021E1DF9D|nr:uncharacterized protein LOC127185862 isoform X2 [Acomys russatus]XP_050998412.1 uncharacterized protein LOC127185863 isoform X2 [Acomys russatus]
MDHLPFDTRRFTDVREWIYKLTGLLSSLSAFVLEIVTARSSCWHVWEFNTTAVQCVSFGLWEANYHQEVNASGSQIKIPVNTPIDSTWTLPLEFQYARLLIFWAILMKPIVLIFCAMAIKISCMKDPFVEMQIYCYMMAALVLFVSSLFAFTSVSLNLLVDLYGQYALEFPPNFPVQKEDLSSKQFTAVFPTGLLIATMSFFGVIMFLSEISYLKQQSQVKSKCASKAAPQKA